MSSLLIAKENGNILHSPMRGIGGTQVPQTRALIDSQRDFNKSLSSVRVVIEQAFGLLKEQWSVYWTNLMKQWKKWRAQSSSVVFYTTHA